MNQNLNLADAILMGSSVVKPKAGVQHEGAGDEQSGCALGMANIAAGVTYINFDPHNPAHRALLDDNARSRGAASVWGDWVKKVVLRPCECAHKTEAEMKNEAISGYGGFDNDTWIHYQTLQLLAGPRNKWIFKLLDREMPIQDVITHLFDCHVMGDPATWTIEQLADWVRSVEGPAREEARLARQKELYEMYWPTTYASSYMMALSDLSGAITPGDDIRYEANADGSITRHPIPRHGAYAVGNGPGVLLGQGSEITLEILQNMVEKIKALPEEELKSVDEEVEK